MHLLFEPTLQSVTRPYIKLNYCLSAILAVVHENCKTSWETTNGINSTNCLDEWKIESKSAICESFSPNPGRWGEGGSDAAVTDDQHLPNPPVLVMSEKWTQMARSETG